MWWALSILFPGPARGKPEGHVLPPRPQKSRPIVRRRRHRACALWMQSDHQGRLQSGQRYRAVRHSIVRHSIVRHGAEGSAAKNQRRSRLLHGSQRMQRQRRLRCPRIKRLRGQKRMQGQGRLQHALPQVVTYTPNISTAAPLCAREGSVA